ncbi:hypothetical protein [Subtercola lobariae]|uniref:Condensation domain-containing protein n=1 Tax=Subtercola lobariae TaxID=1588641 RepID=A0A917B9H6_9MICO|nr:hypothetical protein [Subtercola lobariae]GGF32817.1 hypothetical protein GCM10011399_27440 [Subtercola lobariae]
MTILQSVSTTVDKNDVIRPLGSFENLFDLYTQRLPVQFSVIAELDSVVNPDDVRAALLKLQAAQPLLAVGVSRSGTTASFYRSANPIDLVVAPSGTPWEKVAIADQARALDVTTAPLARCTVVAHAHSSTIVMTFAHQIADGMSAAATLRDLVRALNGVELVARPMPAAQETLLAEAFEARPITPSEAPAQTNESPVQARLLENDESPVLSRLGSVRDFDSTPPDISSLVWPAELTSRVLACTRAQSTTLHALLTAAAVRVMFAETNRGSLALMNPMDIRRPSGADDSLALYFLSTRMGFTAEKSHDVWALAREIRQHIASAHTLEQLAGMSSGMSAASSSVSRVDDAIGAMVSFANYDVMVSNLGDLGTYEGHASLGSEVGAPLDTLGRRPEVGITDLFGPTMATQIAGEQILALSSFNGRLRTTMTTRDPMPHFLQKLRAEVEAAINAVTQTPTKALRPHEKTDEEIS